MATILIYEAAPSLQEKLNGPAVRKRHTLLSGAEHPLETLEEKAPLIVLDANMKWTECRSLLDNASRRGCPILFVTDNRRSSAHLKALYAGPCDTLTAPFSAKAFENAVRTLTGEKKAPPALTLDEATHAALLDGRKVELTAQEYALLLALMENPDTPVSREQLLRTAWGYQSMGETRTVDVHVQRLRKKLGEDFIETVYKCGYRLRMA